MCNKLFVLWEVTRPKRRKECQLHRRFKFQQLQRLRREIQRPSANLKDHAEEVVVISWRVVTKAPWSMTNLPGNWCKLALVKTWSVNVCFKCLERMCFFPDYQAIENIRKSSSLRPSVIPLSFVNVFQHVRSSKTSLHQRSPCNIKVVGHHKAGQNSTNLTMWVFPKIVVPQNGWFIMVPNPIKMDGLGAPHYFWGNTHVKLWLHRIFYHARLVPAEFGAPCVELYCQHGRHPPGQCTWWGLVMPNVWQMSFSIIESSSYAVFVMWCSLSVTAGFLIFWSLYWLKFKYVLSQKSWSAFSETSITRNWTQDWAWVQYSKITSYWSGYELQIKQNKIVL